MRRTIEAICTGTARPFNGAETSAIAKYPHEGTVQLLEEGFAPDEQADRRVHGGPHKAVHLYPLDHHAVWREELQDESARAFLDEPGAFGSNLSVSAIRESDVFIGDRFRLGTALVELSQPRQPCWKVDHRFGVKGMTARIVKTGRSGWYFRVLEIGEVQAGDALERVEDGDRDWSVARVFTALVQGKASRAEWEALARHPRLSPEMQAMAVRRLG
ncbi:MAG: MOSC domain-containing protein [Erythrobacter sp.]|uniref:MOSC domain-containing protein n=1 Tax=Erythrobacter sp. TaxID=1042 RepID=UPI0026258AD0|nr:MOSC domain-containing protein [Erythrobacter sp.]MDJ0978035.1 MOSC domain-containing protein [Erythrobacter sp.]